MSQASAQPSAADANIPLRMRADLAVQPMKFGRRMFWSIKDPLSHRFYQLREEEFFLLQRLDGTTTFRQLMSQFERQFAPRKIDEQQLHRFLGTLHSQALVVSDMPDQGRRLLSRRRFANRSRLLRSFSSILAIRLRGFDPEKLLCRLYPLTAWFFSKWCMFVSIFMGLAALTLVAVQYETLRSRIPEFHAFFSVENAKWIILAIAISKILHELGHALACKHFGGECHEMGVMFLVFAPCLYCNVSDAWLMPNKWHRAAIGAAGIYVEICLATVCTFLWWFSEPGLANTICLNIVFICSVSTLLVNGNPLLRYDGYYILSDLLEVPNLRQQSISVVKRWLGHWVLGVELGNERMLPHRHRGLLAVYAIAAVIYRFFVISAILWFLHAALQPHGLGVFVQLLAVMLVSGMLLLPLWRGIKLVALAARGGTMNWPKFLLWSALAGTVVAGIISVPLPHRITAPAIVEPRGDEIVYVSVPGRITKSVAEGEQVAPGQPIAWLSDPSLAHEIEALRGEVDVLKVRLTSLRTRLAKRSTVLADQIKTLDAAIEDLNRRLSRKLADQERLIVKSPVRGTVMPPRNVNPLPSDQSLVMWSGRPLEKKNRGCYLSTGTTLCHIGDPQQVEAIVVLEQSDIEFIRAGSRVSLALDQNRGETMWGTVEQISDSKLEILPPELLAAGKIPIVMDEQGRARPVNAPYLARVKIDSSDQHLLLRGTGTAKIYAPHRSLGSRLKRYLQDTFRFRI